MFAALVGCGLACAPASAQQAGQPLWELGLGVAGLHLPHYRGSEQSHGWLLPVPYAVYRGPILRADRDGARAVLFDSERVNIDLSLAAGAPTKSRDNRARAGMPDLAPTVEFGPNLNLTLAQGPAWKLQARLPLRAVFTLRSDPQGVGYSTSPVLNLDLRVQGWNLGLQGGPLAASQRLHAYYYSVDPAYATATRPAYVAPSGSAGWRFTLGTSRRLGDFWLGGFVHADSLTGARFDDSPLVTRRHHVAAGFALSWVFARSSQQVAPDVADRH